jgi:leucine dehydrogenase
MHQPAQLWVQPSTMSLFNAKDFDNHEQVTFFADPKTGLRLIIAIHNTKRGPGLGGCRMWHYNSEEEALTDALRLSRGMTYKAAMANLPLGGGKSVVIGNSATDKSTGLFEKIGDCVNALNGRYIIAEDVGITPEDVAIMAGRTPHAVGLLKKGGDPSPVTAYGVYKGIKAACLARLGHENLRDMRFAIQGLGHVGMEILRLLFDDGLITRNSDQIIVSDINDSYIQRARDNFGVTAVTPEKIYEQNVDVFVPSALGAIINDHTVPKLRAKIIAGCANNQLSESRHGQALRDRNILYAPDYVINAGGLINVFHERAEKGYNRQKALDHVLGIYDTLGEVFALAAKHDIPTNLAADRIAEERFK